MLTNINRTIISNKKNKYIVVHYTANNGDTAKGNCNYFKSENRQASAHYFVDEKEIWQCVKDEEVAWHVGGAKRYYNDCRNNNSIGIELCSRKDSNGKYYFKRETIENAQKLISYLMVKYDIPLQNVIRHYDVTRKCCPAPFVDNIMEWKQFKDDISFTDNILFLKRKNRLSSALDWSLKCFEQDKNLKYLFNKWALDVKTIDNLKKQ